jgi:hypothetical protein
MGDAGGGAVKLGDTAQCLQLPGGYPRRQPGGTAALKHAKSASVALA